MYIHIHNTNLQTQGIFTKFKLKNRQLYRLDTFSQLRIFICAIF